MGRYAKYGATRVTSVATVRKRKRPIEFGSVEFFKRLILSTIAFLIITPFTFMLFFIFKSNKLSNEVEELSAIIANNNAIFASPSIEMFGSTESFDTANDIEKIEFLEPIGYQKLYPDMYANSVGKIQHSGEKMVYLTFDDGPSNRTVEVLDILQKYNIKATFFVVYENTEFGNSVLRRIVDEGHTIAVHTASHDYDIIYSSVEAFLEDFNIVYSHIVEVTGVKPDLFRFAGGSINAYNEGIYTEVIAEMLRRGFTYHDWNASAEDASSKATTETIYNTVIETTLRTNKAIVLMHDSGGRHDTISALPRILDKLIENDYSFDKLDPTVVPFLFSYKKPV